MRCHVFTITVSFYDNCAHDFIKFLMLSLRMPYFSPIADCKNALQMSQRTNSVLPMFLITPFFLAKRIDESNARAIIKNVMNSLLFALSIAKVRAERNPATGALILSSRLPHLLIVQSTNLYAVLKHIKKSPKRVESWKQSNLRLKSTTKS